MPSRLSPRSLAALSVLALAGGALGACGGTASESNSGQKNPNANQPPPPFSIVSTGPYQPTVTQPQRALTIATTPTTTTPATNTTATPNQPAGAKGTAPTRAGKKKTPARR